MLLTRLPLILKCKHLSSSFDLHALSAPLAFILSHDQTLRGFESLSKLCFPYLGFSLDLALLPITFQLLRCSQRRRWFHHRSCCLAVASQLLFYCFNAFVYPTKCHLFEMTTPMLTPHRLCNLTPFLGVSLARYRFFVHSSL